MKVFVLSVIIIYMYGAMILKYVAGSESFVEGVSMTIFGAQDELKEKMPFDPYYIGLFVFGFFSVLFSLGNLEEYKVVQMVSTFLRFLSIILMVGTSIVVLFIHGIAYDSAKDIEWFNFDEIGDVFGNTIFVFICHYSISGMIYPVRPQRKIKTMFQSAYIIGSSSLIIEGLFATLAFGSHGAKTSPDKNVFPS